MIDVDALLTVLAEGRCERWREIRSEFTDSALWNNASFVQQLWSSTDGGQVRTVVVGLQDLLNSPCKLELGTLYFRMLASKDAPVRMLAPMLLLPVSLCACHVAVAACSS
jgi:hypothetical protein